MSSASPSKSLQSVSPSEGAGNTLATSNIDVVVESKEASKSKGEIKKDRKEVSYVST
jgi:hypothetical protein